MRSATCSSGERKASTGSSGATRLKEMRTVGSSVSKASGETSIGVSSGRRIGSGAAGGSIATGAGCATGGVSIHDGTAGGTGVAMCGSSTDGLGLISGAGVISGSRWITGAGSGAVPDSSSGWNGTGIRWSPWISTSGVSATNSSCGNWAITSSRGSRRPSPRCSVISALLSPTRCAGN